MNYLAHILLSGPLPAHRIGGLLGDFVRGPLRGERPAAVEQGILLHRQIDGWVDQQPELTEFHRHLAPQWRRYAGIVCDIYYDHLLARHWEHYHSQPLDPFCEQFYAELNAHRALLPARAQLFAERAPQVGWLHGYRHARHLPVILQRVGQRFKKPVALEQLAEQLSYNSEAIEAEFLQLFPRLVAFSQQQRAQWPSSNPVSQQESPHGQPLV